MKPRLREVAGAAASSWGGARQSGDWPAAAWLASPACAGGGTAAVGGGSSEDFRPQAASPSAMHPTTNTRANHRPPNFCACICPSVPACRAALERNPFSRKRLKSLRKAGIPWERRLLHHKIRRQKCGRLRKAAAAHAAGASYPMRDTAEANPASAAPRPPGGPVICGASSVAGALRADVTISWLGCGHSSAPCRPRSRATSPNCRPTAPAGRPR